MAPGAEGKLGTKRRVNHLDLEELRPHIVQRRERNKREEREGAAFRGRPLSLRLFISSSLSLISSLVSVALLCGSERRAIRDRPAGCDTYIERRRLKTVESELDLMRAGLEAQTLGPPIEIVDDTRVGSVDEHLGVTLGQVEPDSAIGSSRHDRHVARVGRTVGGIPAWTDIRIRKIRRNPGSHRRS